MKTVNLFLAKTRGDGEFGENITKGFSYLEIRGEVCISRSSFEKLIIEMERRGLEKPEILLTYRNKLGEFKDGNQLELFLVNEAEIQYIRNLDLDENC